ncbi:MAG: YeeE/YedE family protein [Bacteroidales bacterium]|nr:YeeE/YedE family protein [Bacteroidales bacterium]
MGPLVPDIVSNEFNLIVALLIGIAFGYVLEQAGFSSTKKLVGLFYGYDFTVLRVFFTAGVTAMIGVMLLSHFGLLDMELVYINPTFLWSALIGGAIMGLGFVIGGFCPGTSICAASIGKLDGLAFVFGSLIGVFIFLEGYPSFEHLYLAENWGPVRMDKYLGVSSELFALLMTLMAAFAFIVTTKIENKKNKVIVKTSSKKLIRYAMIGIIPFLLIGLVQFTPNKQELIHKRIAEIKRQKKCSFKEITSDKLAYELVNNHYLINLIDVRSPEKYNEYHLPLAINIPLDSMENREWRAMFKQTYKTNIFYADIDTTAKMACLLSQFLGNSENYILKESTTEFRKQFFEISEPLKNASKEALQVYRFRTEAARELTELVEALKHLNQPIQKKTIKVQGGCS